MTPDTNLSLHEEVLLLALHDEKGTVHTSLFAYAVAGAMVAELLESGRIRIEREKDERVVVVADHTETGDALLDECVREIAAVKRRTALTTWVARLATIRDLRNRIAQQLCERGILSRSEDRVLWVFPRVRFPTADPGPEHHLVEALRAAIMSDGDVDAHHAVLIALTYPTGILSHVVEPAALKTRRDRLEALVRMDEVSGATKDAIAAAQAAMEASAAAVAAATVAATS